jgi:hypothetical protein
MLLVFFIGAANFAFTQEIFYGNFPHSSIVFNDSNTITIYQNDLMTDNVVEKHGKYNISTTNAVPFINIIWEDKTEDSFLMLLNEIVCFFYKDDNYPFLAGFNGRNPMRNDTVHNMPEKITATSFLVENNIKYSPMFTNTKIGQVWAEGSKGQGIHEKLYIQQPGCVSINISIGFVSIKKPDLYQKNSRPKIINLGVEGKYSFDVVLEDTPNYQKIKLPSPLDVTDILVIEILDVYEGSEYEDTCINSILYDMSLFQNLWKR